ncbi:MAG: hypothetical protein QGM45_10115, partial [Anaerolineales bacterium]|nr:hypothetical protein [Anaerolineales bacterium]
VAHPAAEPLGEVPLVLSRQAKCLWCCAARRRAGSAISPECVLAPGSPVLPGGIHADLGL